MQQRFLAAGAVSLLGVYALLIAPAAAQTAGPTLSVNVFGPRRPISPLIYGMNTYAVDASFAAEIRAPVSRWGGNHTTRYNWQVDGSNAGDDFYFMGGESHGTAVPGAVVDALIDTNRANGSQSIITIPMIDYINKAVNWDCSYPVSLIGPQQAVNPFIRPFVNGVQTEAGNGRRPDGTPIRLTTEQILRVHVPNTTAIQADWVSHLMGKYGSAQNGGVRFYEMDNEPGGWANTHRDVHPDDPTYTEIIAKTIPYAAAVKATDPTALVLGPGDFGFPVYRGQPENHGGLWNAERYLKAMADYERANGVRILDYMDEHYYPILQSNSDADRFVATRSLWDPTYVESFNYIGQFFGSIHLIPRMKEWVRNYYPGTKISITEYNFGALDRLNGALVQTDVLGIFGREGLDMATIWGPPAKNQPGAFAFRMFRNYDGRGAKYGDVFLQSVSADQSKLAVYCAKRNSDAALTVMVINKTTGDLSAPLALNGFVPRTTGKRGFRYSGANLNAIQTIAVPATPATGVNSSSLTAVYPANSVTLWELPHGAKSVKAR